LLRLARTELKNNKEAAALQLLQQGRLLQPKGVELLGDLLNLASITNDSKLQSEIKRDIESYVGNSINNLLVAGRRYREIGDYKNAEMFLIKARDNL
jgi:hypothetical protein